MLGTDDDCLGAIKAIDAIDDLVEATHLLNLFCVDVEQVLLDGTVRADTHDNHTGFLVLIALTVDFLQHVASGTYDGDGAAGGSDEPRLLEVPVLGEVFTEGVCIHEDTYC